MAIPRRELVDSETPGFYHCLSRCVRRAYLCGDDPFTGNNCDHRKQWIEKRLLELASVFAVELYAYAVMDNHYHLVLSLDPLAPRQWSDSQVAEKWLLAYPGFLDEAGNEQQRELKKQAIMADKKKLESYRERLGSLSWFMSRLNEPLAKTSNFEDSVKGRFWESRFTSVALLDESAVLSCMSYVDLNPIRTGIVEDLQSSLYTSIQKRVKELTTDRSLLTKPIDPIAYGTVGRAIQFKLRDYIELVEWTGKSIIHPHKAKMSVHIKSLLTSMNLQSDNWLKQILILGEDHRYAMGSIERLKDRASKVGKKWLKGMTSTRKLYVNQ